jgi:hypothetical protein
MPFYNLVPLPLPAGYDQSRAYKINDHQAVVGTSTGPLGRRATLWQPGSVSLLNLPGQYSEGYSLNLDKNVVGVLDRKPFFWKKSTGVTTILKGTDGQPADPGEAHGINKFNQITGWVRAPGGLDVGTVWPSDTDIPIDLLTGVPFKPPFPRGYGKDINDNGFIVGYAATTGILIGSSGIGQEGFSWTINEFKIFLDPKLTGQPDYYATAANDLLTPQIVGGIYEYGWLATGPTSAIMGSNAFIYDSATAGLQVLGIPGDLGDARDINNNGDAVGAILDVFGGTSLAPGANAVLWIFNGLIRVNLNHPTISNAQAKGWHLIVGTSINNNGYIVGWGYLNSDKTNQLPFMLKPIIPVRKIPIEYMLPQALWPGQAWDGPRPKGWPFKIPFPIPSPNPFQIVGSAFNHLNNILISKNVNEITSEMSDAKTRKGIQKITSRLIDEEMRKLKVILANASKVKRSRIASKGRK